VRNALRIEGLDESRRRGFVRDRIDEASPLIVDLLQASSLQRSTEPRHVDVVRIRRLGEAQRQQQPQVPPSVAQLERVLAR
jgi:hypothetical protein